MFIICGISHIPGGIGQVIQILFLVGYPTPINAKWAEILGSRPDSTARGSTDA